MSKAALEALARTLAAEMASTNVRVNLFAPGRTRTRMVAAAFPGIDPMTLPTPETVAEAILPLCSPDFTESGKVYDFRSGKLRSFRPPA
jgi:NAD(P)-dependent dehydrogenase (short-subunit alcohol dehydrogenase family)